MSILDSIFGHSGHYVGMVYHAPGEPHVGCPYCKQPPRLSNASHGYQPTGPRIDPRKVFEPGQPASGVQPPMATCQQSPDAESTPDADCAVAQMALAVGDLDSAIAHITAAEHDDKRLHEFLAVIRRALRGQRDALEAEVTSHDKA